MRESRLLASAALFRALYDNNKDIYDVISAFIRASILLNSKWTFNATECTQYLLNDFGFNLPEAVVRTCLKNRLKRNGELALTAGVFSVAENFKRDVNIQPEFQQSLHEYEEITKSLVLHVKQSLAPEINEEKLNMNIRISLAIS